MYWNEHISAEVFCVLIKFEIHDGLWRIFQWLQHEEWSICEMSWELNRNLYKWLFSTFLLRQYDALSVQAKAFVSVHQILSLQLCLMVIYVTMESTRWRHHVMDASWHVIQFIRISIIKAGPLNNWLWPQTTHKRHFQVHPTFDHHIQLLVGINYIQ